MRSQGYTDGMDQIDIAFLGEPMVEFSRLPGAEPRYLQGFGGDTMNAAIAAARQGARVSYITRLGSDAFGEALLDLWRTEGVGSQAVQLDAQAPTAVYFIDHGPDGHRFTYLRQGSAASRMTPADLPVALLRSSRYLHTSGITQAISESACDSVFAAIELARKAEVKVSFDANLRLRLWPLARARTLILAAAALSDLFLLSQEDAAALSGLGDPAAMLDWAHGLGVPRVVLKLGASGVLASDGGRRLRHPGFRVDCVDATGAGDCFAGALLTRLCRGESFDSALAYANAAAALTTTAYGAVAPLPRATQVNALLAGA